MLQGQHEQILGISSNFFISVLMEPTRSNLASIWIGCQSGLRGSLGHMQLFGRPTPPLKRDIHESQKITAVRLKNSRLLEVHTVCRGGWWLDNMSQKYIDLQYFLNYWPTLKKLDTRPPPKPQTIHVGESFYSNGSQVHNEIVTCQQYFRQN